MLGYAKYCVIMLYKLNCLEPLISTSELVAFHLSELARIGDGKVVELALSEVSRRGEIFVKFEVGRVEFENVVV